MKTRPAYADWLKQVDAEIVHRTGLSSADLPDFLYDEEYEDGATVKQAACAAIRAAHDY